MSEWSVDIEVRIPIWDPYYNKHDENDDSILFSTLNPFSCRDCLQCTEKNPSEQCDYADMVLRNVKKVFGKSNVSMQKSESLPPEYNKGCGYQRFMIEVTDLRDLGIQLFSMNDSALFSKTHFGFIKRNILQKSQ